MISLKQLKNRIPLIVICSIILLAMIFVLVFYLHSNPVMLMNTQNRAKMNIAVAEEILDLKYPGSWHIKEGTLYKGETEINNNFVLVDHIKELTGDSCSIYVDNVCVSTTVIQSDCNIRDVGKPIPKDVKSKPLEEGRYYFGETKTEGDIYQTIYKPLINDDKQVIGVLLLSMTRDLYNDMIYGSMITIGITGLVIALILGLVIRLLIRRPTKLLQNVAAVERAAEQIQVQDNEDKDNDIEMSELWHDILQELPKGLSPITLKEIVTFLKETGNEVTVKDVSGGISLSKVTVRRYLDYLEEHGLVDIEQEYGSVGRPLKIYRLRD